MRVLHIFDHCIPWQTGYSVQSIALLRALNARGIETVQMTGPRQGSLIDGEEVVEGWSFFRVPRTESLMSGTALLAELEQMGDIRHRVEHIVKRTRPRIIHAHSPALNGIPALRVSRRLGLPYVYEVRAFWEDAAVAKGRMRDRGLRYRSSQWLENYVLKRADAVVATSDNLGAELARRGVKPEKLQLIHHGVEQAPSVNEAEVQTARQILGLGDELVVGYIGSNGEDEGLPALLDAVQALASEFPQLRLLWLGAGADASENQNRIGTAEVSGRVIRSGRVPHREMRRYFSVMDIVVNAHASLRQHEYCPSVALLEAMAAGRAVVASNVGGNRELITDQETGLLFQAGDKNALRGCLAELLRCADRRARLGAAARAWTAKRTWEESGRHYQELYERLSDRGRQKKQ